MSQAVLVEVTCDADGCDQRVRGWHWSGLGAASTVRSALRARGWATVKDGEGSGHTAHFCPRHPEHLASKRRGLNRGERCGKWVDEA